MKLDSIYVSKFLGVDVVEMRLPKRVQLFAGPNAAGKSSLRDAVALALTADLGRVTKRQEAVALIRDGSDLAVCEVRDADGDEYRVTINRSGKIVDSRSGRDTNTVLQYVVDAQRFARLDAKERSAFLFGLMGVATDAPAVRERLLAAGCDAKKVERIAPLLRSGFEAASKDAKAKATEAKGAWRGVTGETYGSEKAKAWSAAVPAFDAPALARAETELKHLDVAIEQWQQQLGQHQAEQQRRLTIAGKLPALQEHAGRIGRIETKLATDEATLADVVQQLAAAGGAPRVGLVHDMAKALTFLMVALPTPAEGDPIERQWDAAQEVLDRYVDQHGAVLTDLVGDPQAAARLPELQRAHATATSAVANDRRDLEAARQAKAEADAITAELSETFDAAGMAEAQQKVADLKLERATLLARLGGMRSAKAAAEAAADKTKQAAQHAADVAAWDAIGDALGPDGIPAQLLAEALGPINDRLAQSAADANWPTVVIGADMAVTAGGREYRLLSESEKWRADAMLAEAVAHLSGVHLLVLDRFDVLDLQGRADAIGWLDVLADTGEIHTALVFATLKSLPTNLPETFQAHWITGGVCADLKEAA